MVSHGSKHHLDGRNRVRICGSWSMEASLLYVHNKILEFSCYSFMNCWHQHLRLKIRCHYWIIKCSVESEPNFEKQRMDKISLSSHYKWKVLHVHRLCDLLKVIYKLDQMDNFQKGQHSQPCSWKVVILGLLAPTEVLSPILCHSHCTLIYSSCQKRHF